MSCMATQSGAPASERNRSMHSRAQHNNIDESDSCLAMTTFGWQPVCAQAMLCCCRESWGEWPAGLEPLQAAETGA